MITTQSNVGNGGGCTPCQQAAMARMTIPQRLAFMKSLGLTAELKALEESLAASGYQLPAPTSI
jgi:hypothetical protein